VCMQERHSAERLASVARAKSDVVKYVLGLSLRSHDVAFYVLDENRNLVFGVEEERFAFTRYEIQATYLGLEYMLERYGLNKEDFVAVGLASSKTGYQELTRIHAELYGDEFARGNVQYVEQLFDIKSAIIESMGFANARTIEVPHHTAHALCGFGQSPFESALVLAVDGSGDQNTTVLYLCQEDKIHALHTIARPHSIGWVWQALTQWCRLGKLGNEGKLMGLASYGDSIYVDDFYRGFPGRGKANVPFFEIDWETGHFSSPLCQKLFSKELTMEDVLGEMEPYDRMPGKFAQDVAASLQKVTNDMLQALCAWGRVQTGESNLVICGGVAMNSVANGELKRHADFAQVFVPPNSSDNGNGLGAALFAHGETFPSSHDKRYRLSAHTMPYVGPEFSPEEMSLALDEFSLPYVESKDLIEDVAEMLSKGLVVGWFQGRMEIGARALGNRSILANPTLAEMKNVVNARVKFREFWRPFAPVIKKDKYHEWFEDCFNDVPCMTSTHYIRQQQRAHIPSVTHVDGTGRVQTCSSEDNAKLYDLLSAFERRTGVPVLLNTSFNIKGMPIVCRPEDAVKCFLGTAMDVLVLGDFVVRRADVEPTQMLDPHKMCHPLMFFAEQIKSGDVVAVVCDASMQARLSDLQEIAAGKGAEIISCGLEEEPNGLSFGRERPVSKVMALVDYSDNFPNGAHEVLPHLRYLKKVREVMDISDQHLYLLNFSGASWILGHIFGDGQWEKVI